MKPLSRQVGKNKISCHPARAPCQLPSFKVYSQPQCVFQGSPDVDTAIELHNVPAEALPPRGNTTDTAHNHLILGEKSISKLGLLSVYMIKNDKVLPFIFIKRREAEQNNLLSSSARFICLAKPGGGRKGGWKAVATPGPHYPPSSSHRGRRCALLRVAEYIS